MVTGFRLWIEYFRLAVGVRLFWFLFLHFFHFTLTRMEFHFGDGRVLPTQESRITCTKCVLPLVLLCYYFIDVSNECDCNWMVFRWLCTFNICVSVCVLCARVFWRRISHQNRTTSISLSCCLRLLVDHTNSLVVIVTSPWKHSERHKAVCVCNDYSAGV